MLFMAHQSPVLKKLATQADPSIFLVATAGNVSTISDIQNISIIHTRISARACRMKVFGPDCTAGFPCTRLICKTSYLHVIPTCLVKKHYISIHKTRNFISDPSQPARSPNPRHSPSPRTAFTQASREHTVKSTSF